MAIAHFSQKSVSRNYISKKQKAKGNTTNGKYQSATATAAYRSRTKLIDEFTGITHNYSKHKDKPLLNGIEFPKDTPTLSLQELYNAIDKAETKSNSRTLRTVDIALPNELNDNQNIELVQNYIKALVNRYQTPIDYSIHNDPNNKHFHYGMPTRTYNAQGFQAKLRCLDDNKQGPLELEAQRQLWQQCCNQALAKAHEPSRIDVRSFYRQGITNKAPGKHLGKAKHSLIVAETQKKNTNKRYNTLSSTLKNLFQRLFKTPHKTLETPKKPQLTPIPLLQQQQPPKPPQTPKKTAPLPGNDNSLTQRPKNKPKTR